MTSVGHYMWVYTNDQNLHIIQTAKMKTIACVVLQNSSPEVSQMKTIVCDVLQNSSPKVSQMLHVPEWHTVLVLWKQSEIWCLYDGIGPSGLYKIGTLQLKNVNNPISSLCTVTFENTTEVWATRKNKEILILEHSLSGCCEINSNVLVCNTGEFGGHDCQLITCLYYADDEKRLTHVWVSFNESSQLVCWDGPNKSQEHTISLNCEGQTQ